MGDPTSLEVASLATLLTDKQFTTSAFSPAIWNTPKRPLRFF